MFSKVFYNYFGLLFEATYSAKIHKSLRIHHSHISLVKLLSSQDLAPVILSILRIIYLFAKFLAKNINAKNAALNYSNLICFSDSLLDQGSPFSIPLLTAPHPVIEASEKISRSNDLDLILLNEFLTFFNRHCNSSICNLDILI